MDNSEKHAYVSGAQDMLDACLKLKGVKPSMRVALLEKFHSVTKSATTKLFAAQSASSSRDVAHPADALN